MATIIIDELVQKADLLSNSEVDVLIERLKQKRHRINKNGKSAKKGYVSPNTIWVKEHHDEYAGNYVALKDGELVAFGRTIKEADQAAKAKGVTDPLLHYIPAKDEVLWGGW